MNITKNEHCCVCCLFLPSGLLCCCATRANSDRCCCCHWRFVRLRDEFLRRSPSDFWCLREKTQDWEVRFWVSSIRLVRRTGLLHSSMLGAILPAILGHFTCHMRAKPEEGRVVAAHFGCCVMCVVYCVVMSRLATSLVEKLRLGQPKWPIFPH